MIINKSQGQTLERVAIYLRQPCFSPGQLYVPLSRARQPSKVSVVSVKTDGKLTREQVHNVISFDVICMAGII
ncbi:hypothetical protein vseg_016176 [Gypsophila vaccaria]